MTVLQGTWVTTEQVEAYIHKAFIEVLKDRGYEWDLTQFRKDWEITWTRKGDRVIIVTTMRQEARARYELLSNDWGTKPAVSHSAIVDIADVLATVNAPVDPFRYGKSAYVMAVEAGFEGTSEQWLAALKGTTPPPPLTSED